MMPCGVGWSRAASPEERVFGAVLSEKQVRPLMVRDGPAEFIHRPALSHDLQTFKRVCVGVCQAHQRGGTSGETTLDRRSGPGAAGAGFFQTGRRTCVVHAWLPGGGPRQAVADLRELPADCDPMPSRARQPVGGH